MRASCTETENSVAPKRVKAYPWRASDHTALPDKEADPDISIISGTASHDLSRKVCTILNRQLSDVDINKFSDGEIFVNIKESMRGKDVFIIQTCSPPVNDSVMELLLTVAAAKRSGANTVTAVVPYFGYKLNRRGLPINTTHQTRFLWNAAGDLAKMLQVAGVDKVVSVDLQRPGQGHEACFFNVTLPAETIATNDLFVDYFRSVLEADWPVAVVSPNTEYAKKAKKFQKKLLQCRPELQVDYAAFLRSDAEPVSTVGKLELQGDIKGKDVILIEDYIGKSALAWLFFRRTDLRFLVVAGLDSTVHLTILCNRLMKEGARRVFICASHGHFDAKAMRLIDLSPIAQVVISDSIALPERSTAKIVQLSIAALLATVIQSDVAYLPISEFNPSEESEDGDYVLE
jgi:ribose-phosphate pyrophosphokinase